jgi:Uma2 family endonuclease
MMEAGILKSGDRYELLNGWIVPKMTIHPPHNKAVRQLMRRLNRLLRDDEWTLQIQGSVTLLPASEPEPDAVVAFGPEEKYGENVNFGAKDIVLIVEVADSSLAHDRDEKLRIYALARIPVYWIVNLIDRQVEVYTLPRAGRNPVYRERKDYGPADTLPLILDGEHVADLPVKAILP